MNPFDKIKVIILEIEDDFNKFYNNQNAAAGTRIRKSMQQLKSMAQAIRTEVQNTKSAGIASRPIVKRASAPAAKKAAPAKGSAKSAAKKGITPSNKKDARGNGGR